MMKNEGLLLANEIHLKRVWDLAENLEPTGVTNAVVTNESPGKLADQFGASIDRIMLEAPCSGDGMLRKSYAACREWNHELSKSCAARQYAILEQAARLAMPGGLCAYTTCTFSPIENEAGSYLYRCADEMPDLDGLKVVHPGWWLGSLQKVRFTPSHALAVEIEAEVAQQTMPLQLGEPQLSACLPVKPSTTRVKMAGL